MGSLVVVPGLESTGSVVVVHGLSYSAACGIFPAHVFCIGGQILHPWTTRETLKYTYFLNDLRKSSFISVSCKVKEGCDWAE